MSLFDLCAVPETGGVTYKGKGSYGKSMRSTASSMCFVILLTNWTLNSQIATTHWVASGSGKDTPNLTLVPCFGRRQGWGY
jgi:hypothetical protein